MNIKQHIKHIWIDIILENILYHLDLIKYHPVKKLRVDCYTNVYRIGKYNISLSQHKPLILRLRELSPKNILVYSYIISMIINPILGTSLLGLGLFFGATIAYDTSNGGHDDDPSGSFSFTCGSGSNRILLGGVCGNPQGTPYLYYNGVQATSITTTVRGGRMFYLINPASGAHTLSWGNISQSSTAVLTLTGAAQTSPIESYNSNSSSSGGVGNTSVTTTTDNAMVIAYLAIDGRDSGYIVGATSVGGGGPSMNYNSDLGYYFKATAGTVTMSSSNLGLREGGLIMVVVKNYVASGPSELKTMNGLTAAQIKTRNGLEIGKMKTINGLS